MDWQQELTSIVHEFGADSGTIHLIGPDGALHLTASTGIPEVVLDRVRIVPIGKGMAGLAAQRQQPVTVCNLQTDATGDVRPGAKLTGMEGAIALPMMRGSSLAGVLGVANRGERTFTPEEEERLLAHGRRLSDYNEASTS